MEMLGRHGIFDVLRSCDCLARTIRHRLATDVNACMEASRAYSFGPSKQIIGLLLKQTPTVFLIEEKRCTCWKTFSIRGLYRSVSVGQSQGIRRGSAFCFS